MKVASISKTDVKKVNFIKNLNKEEYSLYCTHYRIEDVQEVIRMNYLLPASNFLHPVKIKDIDFVLFSTKNAGIVVDFVCKINEGKYELYEMSTKAYNQYERYMTSTSDNN
ncbi:MAG: hypothetical protein LBG15_07515 [Dysgonamonadaceae bacterium]|jgi:hypothetical protein|nr:hypothetical protein [Dysgonamonadaceae bacterium]